MSDFYMDIRMEDVPQKYRFIPEGIGLENFIRLCDLCGGQTIYFPKSESIMRKSRNREIAKKFYSGEDDVFSLTRKYGLCSRQIQIIIQDSKNQTEEDGKTNDLYSICISDIAEDQRDIAEYLGIDIYMKLCSLVGGISFDVPKKGTLLRGPRNRDIVARFNGKNVKELETLFRLSDTQIRKIIKNAGVSEQMEV